MNALRVVRFWGVAVGLFSAGAAFADRPLSNDGPWRSQNLKGRYVAVSGFDGTSVIDVDAVKVLWKIPEGSRLVFISADGHHLALGYSGLNLIELDADNSLELIGFWEDGRKIASVPLSQIVPDRSILRRTVSHYEWGQFQDVIGNKIIIKRVDGKLFSFDLTTGRAD